jgi:hypothetical protein
MKRNSQLTCNILICFTECVTSDEFEGPGWRVAFLVAWNGLCGGQRRNAGRPDIVHQTSRCLRGKFRPEKSGQRPPIRRGRHQIRERLPVGSISYYFVVKSHLWDELEHGLIQDQLEGFSDFFFILKVSVLHINCRISHCGVIDGATVTISYGIRVIDFKKN